MTITDPLPEIYSFSSGYCLVEGMYVQPIEDTQTPLVHDHLYAYLQDQVYGDTSTSMLLRHNDARYHFQIHPSNGTRIDTIEMPFELVDRMDLDRFPDEEQFLIAKPDHAKNLYNLSTLR